MLNKESGETGYLELYKIGHLGAGHQYSGHHQYNRHSTHPTFPPSPQPDPITAEEGKSFIRQQHVECYLKQLIDFVRRVCTQDKDNPLFQSNPNFR